MKKLMIRKMVFCAMMLSLIVMLPSRMVMANEVQSTENTQAAESNATETVKPAETNTEVVVKPVTKPVAKPTIKISAKSISLEKGQKKKLAVSKKNATGKAVVWTTSNKKIATVNKYGEVRAYKKGKATITARIAGTNVKATCQVVVKNYVTMRVRTTGYCNCRKCAGRWAGHPTASGRMPRANRTIAVDRRLIKLGTKVQIGNKMYVAEDTGGAIKGKRIDIYYSSHRQARRHGVKYKTIKVYY